MSISNTVPINPTLLDDLEKHATTLQHALDDLLVTLRSQLSEADLCVTETLSLQHCTIHTLNTSVQTAIDDTTDLIHACESLASDLDARLPPLATHMSHKSSASIHVYNALQDIFHSFHPTMKATAFLIACAASLAAVQACSSGECQPGDIECLKNCVRLEGKCIENCASGDNSCIDACVNKYKKPIAQAESGSGASATATGAAATGTSSPVVTGVAASISSAAATITGAGASAASGVVTGVMSAQSSIMTAYSGSMLASAYSSLGSSASAALSSAVSSASASASASSTSGASNQASSQIFVFTIAAMLAAAIAL